MASVLFVGVDGQDPNIDLPPNVSSQELNAAINKGADAMKGAGYTVNLFLPPIMEGIAALETELQQKQYDLVLVSVSGTNLSAILSGRCRWRVVLLTIGLIVVGHQDRAEAYSVL